MLLVQALMPLSTGNNDESGVWLPRHFQDALKLFSCQLLKEGAKDINVGGSASLRVSMNNFGIFDGNLAGSASPVWWVPLRSTRIGTSALSTPSVGKTPSSRQSTLPCAFFSFHNITYPPHRRCRRFFSVCFPTEADINN